MTAAELRRKAAEIERLEREHGADESFPVTFVLLQAQSAVLKARESLDQLEARKVAV